MKSEIKIMAVILVIVIVGAFVGANYYRGSVQQERQPTTPNSTLIRDDSPTLGPADAKVTIVEFLDPECESCASFAPTVKKILKDYDGKTRLVVRYMPLHPNSMRAATFLEAAGEQGKYWQAQEMLFEKQGEWGTRHGPATGAPPPDIGKLFDGYAQSLGLDLEKVDAAAKENRYAAKLDRDRRDGQSLGVRQTPTFFVNGRQVVRFGETDLRTMIEEEMKK
ncbi:MAG: thioredoxin domain-containing protein [Pyrinomonadaceae bacterium]